MPHLSLQQLATAGLASQGRATIMADGMNDEERGWIAATMNPNGTATVDTAEACRRAVRSYYDRNKATGDDAEE
jgi:hypothetical protein